jgi:hypothetical protein
VHVRVRERAHELLDVDDQHVGVGRTDVVLDDEARLAPRRGRAEPGVLEPERCRATQAAHERLHDGAVAGLEFVHGGAVEYLSREDALQPVERLVHVHHEQVRTVARVALDARQRIDAAAADQFALRLQRPRQQRRGALRDRRPQLRRQLVLARLDRAHHDAQVVAQRVHDLRQCRHAVGVGVDAVRLARHVVEAHVVDARLQPLVAQARRQGHRVVDLVARRLQQREQVLDPVVRRERLVHQARQGELAFAE